MTAATTPRFKENTGFCCRCRQWKLLVHDRFQTCGNADKKKSSYCIACDEVIRQSEERVRKLRNKKHSTTLYSHQFPGHESRILYHQDRIAHETARLTQEGRAA